MENFRKLLRFAKKMELKYIIAQQTATAGDIQDALYKAKLGPVKPDGSIDANLQNELINKISPYLDAAGVPASSSVNIKLNVSAGPSVSFTVLIDPSNPKASQTLSLKFLKDFSKPMMAAIKNAGLSVTGTVTADWLGIGASK